MIATGYTTPDDWQPGLLADWQILQLCQTHQMIAPFIDHQCSEHGVISYGLSSYGYDVRLFNQFKVFTNVNAGVIDPTNFSDGHFVDKEADECIIPPNGFLLARTLEYFILPNDVLAICMAKSTLARVGIVVGVTPIEPAFEGTITLELSNTTTLPVRIRSFQGICQFLFFKGSAPCRTTYADRKGKYQKQTDVTLPRVIGLQVADPTDITNVLKS